MRRILVEERGKSMEIRRYDRGSIIVAILVVKRILKYSQGFRV